MRTVFVAVFSMLLSTALSAPVKVKEEKTMFLGEDFQILLPNLAADVVFLPRSNPSGPEVPLMTAGSVVNPLAILNAPAKHLIVYNLKEEHEGLYTVKNNENPNNIERITLIVRDCSVEQSVKYGDNYHIQLTGVTPPITLEYRHIAIEANQTNRPALVLFTQTGVARDGYQGRISVNDRRVTLNVATGSDEGSYTVREADGKIKKKVCLNVKEHQIFPVLPYAGTLKINLILNSSMVQIFYTPDYDLKPRLIVDKGNLVFPPDLSLEGRLSLEGSVCILESLTGSDTGHFQVSDTLGFPVSNVYLVVEAYKLPPVYVAIISLVGLLAFLLLVCLLSCLFKVRKRAKRAEALEKIAHSKVDDGEAFRQVVKNITQFNEDSKGHSVADNTDKSQSTEVDIKGLEVSSKEVLEGANLETSDSGVEFNTTGLPLDTDTDVPDHFLDSEAVSLSATHETKASAPPAPEFKPTPVPEVKPSAPAPVVKASPVPEAKPSPPPVIKSSPLPQVKSSPPPQVKSSPPPVVKSSPPPEIKSSPPPVVKSSPPPEIKSSPPPVVKSSPPPEVKSSPPPVIKSSPPPEIKSSPPPVIKSSPPPEIKSSPPPVIKSSPPPVVKSSPPPVIKSSPPPEVKSSPPPVIKSSPPPEVKSSPPPVIKSSPPPEVKSSPPPVIKSSPPPEVKSSPEPPAVTELLVIKPVDSKPSPVQSPDRKLVPSPISKPKTPEPTPSPKLTTPLSLSPKTTESQPPSPKLAMTPDPPKPTTPEPTPTTNGTPEPPPESKPATDHAPADLIGGSSPKATPPKTPEVEVTAAKEPPLEVSSGSPALQAKGDDSAPAKVEDATTVTTT
ncbi:histone-lysine N-methyltransferase 2D [Osmerus mordax]|uniref:histone-lysine N-methyltransferase 2D n=1 Tax=Osmerus mordax TaxID=8014 RepID=UPI00350FE41A